MIERHQNHDQTAQKIDGIEPGWLGTHGCDFRICHASCRGGGFSPGSRFAQRRQDHYAHADKVSMKLPRYSASANASTKSSRTRASATWLTATDIPDRATASARFGLL